ncbi:uncharacterized protein LAESUDRAFT_716949 [Laetiporus sulphureus 93-53]|uniref:Uncharacterized protein n=1 Tax=Laetiporus sulphureus 93-53 TaxID=1314785 RepID=A0A165C7X8_9APHY|nr:uncharacterized protein LAESUDRAFT_716949 [Laetiporus sulphureus 93-53]KZT02357.1 hypothetical protein LAESUDRAFT_716949 [Laetiporus sulphureus 93-53]
MSDATAMRTKREFEPELEEERKPMVIVTIDPPTDCSRSSSISSSAESSLSPTASSMTTTTTTTATSLSTSLSLPASTSPHPPHKSILRTAASFTLPSGSRPSASASAPGLSTNVTFAPLPATEPRRRKSSVQLGVAARSRMLHRRRMLREQGIESYEDEEWDDEHTLQDGNPEVVEDDLGVDPAEEAIAAIGRFVKGATRSLFRRISSRRKQGRDPSPMPPPLPTAETQAGMEGSQLPDERTPDHDGEEEEARKIPPAGIKSDDDETGMGEAGEDTSKRIQERTLSEMQDQPEGESAADEKEKRDEEEVTRMIREQTEETTSVADKSAAASVEAPPGEQQQSRTAAILDDKPHKGSQVIVEKHSERISMMEVVQLEPCELDAEKAPAPAVVMTVG